MTGYVLYRVRTTIWNEMLWEHWVHVIMVQPIHRERDMVHWWMVKWCSWEGMVAIAQVSDSTRYNYDPSNPIFFYNLGNVAWRNKYRRDGSVLGYHRYLGRSCKINVAKSKVLLQMFKIICNIQPRTFQ